MNPLEFPGSHFTRRHFLVGGSLALTALTAFPDTPACILTSEQEEGPYYLNSELVRRDITEGKPGVPLTLAVRLVNAKNCEPLSKLAFDIWHCDALGVYSGFAAGGPEGGPGGPGGRGDRGPGGPPPGFGPNGPGGPGRGRGPVNSLRFLRGVGLSNADGVVEFSTLYPGWYSGRAIHIHMKVHAGGGTGTAGHVAHTGQLFFPEDLTERIARMEPYATRLDVHRTTQGEDMVFGPQHGSECMLRMEKLGRAESDGFRATATLAIDPEATPAPVGVRGGGRGGPPPPQRS